MQQGHSPPKHRHDGSSPLPLGMDWSPPPRKWNGRGTVWPHDPRSGWSYCITIPSWIVLPKSRDSDPVVFYRVLVGIQSPEGVTTTRGILRRFNDFLKLYSALRKAFSQKNLPTAPPKGFLRLKSRAMLEERQHSLDDWMAKLLSDIDISRSLIVASFLELEAAARSSFQDDKQQTTQSNVAGNDTVSSLPSHAYSSISFIAGNASHASDDGTDTAYETSEIGTPSLGRDNYSDVGTEDISLDEDLTGSIQRLMKYGVSNIDEGLLMGNAILDQLEGVPKHRVLTGEIDKVISSSINNGNIPTASHHSGIALELLSENELGKAIGHSRSLSNGSVESATNSLRGSESSSSWFPNEVGDGALEMSRGAVLSKTAEIQSSKELQHTSGATLVLPQDQQQQMNRVLMSMQRRLATAKTDMEDLISRLNQEISVKDYLTTKVKDLEVELETTKTRSKENLQHAILLERDRFTQMQWDMEELKRKSLEMELKLTSQQDETSGTVLTEVSTNQGQYLLLQELETTKQLLNDLLKKHRELELKSKADVKVLVKEVKNLRSSQAELKQLLNQSLADKAEAEKLLQHEIDDTEEERVSRRKLLHECEALHNRLRECNMNFLEETEDKLVLNSSSIQDTLDLLAISDNRIKVLLAEAQLLSQDDNNPELKNSKNPTINTGSVEDIELRKTLSEILIENVVLRKQASSVVRYTIRNGCFVKRNDTEAPS